MSIPYKLSVTRFFKKPNEIFTVFYKERAKITFFHRALDPPVIKHRANTKYSPTDRLIRLSNIIKASCQITDLLTKFSLTSQMHILCYRCAKHVFITRQPEIIAQWVSKLSNFQTTEGI